MSTAISRRTAIKSTLALGASINLCAVASAQKPKTSDKLNVAVIGVGGQGKGNLNAMSKENVVALCDVDSVRAGDAFDRFPQARRFQDFREMFDRMEKEIDAVVISTPDHTHFHPAHLAISLGKHVYLEKPMGHSVWEVRELTRLAAEKNVATQLGVQRHTLKSIRDAVEIIRAGAIGEVKEVHSWVGGQRGMPAMPKEFPTPPESLNWDLWLGPAAERPYAKDYCPYNWRFWWDFGTGEAGNWGCHILDIPFWALGLTYPTRVTGNGPEVDAQRTPKSMHTTMDFPATDDRRAVQLHWYHGTPPILAELGIIKPKGNNLFIGTQGMLVAGFETVQLLPTDQFVDFKTPSPTIPRSPGFHTEWLNACRGGEKASCDFSYSGPLTEAVLLGNVGYRAGAFDWDSTTLKASTPEAQALIKPPYRKGWEV
ncbi:MAG TPA: NADH-dependent dehydrogenase [Planctomycetaceae bacterium]|nr:NADH-dependent dehydrogenase [Planctomycetaceae bacterium]